MSIFFQRLQCKIDGVQFRNPDDLHEHIKSVHKLKLKDYWETYWPVENLVTGEKVRYKSFDTYFDSFFDDKRQLQKFCDTSPPEKVKEVLLAMLESRMSRKGLKLAPCEVEMQTSKMPSVSIYERHFGSYEKACELIKVKPVLNSGYEKKNKNFEKNPLILIDTREQKPLSFPNFREEKLAIGDYGLGDVESYTFVDRKSPDDFKGTMTQGFDRFCREVERVQTLDCFLYVVVEESIEDLKKSIHFQKHNQASIEYVFKNMREIIYRFPGRIQFIFTGGRKNSEKFIPYLLMAGSDLWDYDIQYYLEKKGLL